ncbi:lytic transglycosylase domain-containing protein [bacterium M00.F.Ca.ET.228.01.1.1]|uniref:transglycosylase SLT domain-containing protein n=1 Tax=Paraburkholderia phenoliruptrix TaxID=252970 RepID=UPI001092219D|nr:transglycosylase SLT domain-containing protein [Paraburkholderia phenoliruptrix]TGP45156.1 lytic transglycosylase domain-containing protein [bacterium M00.F.Ca.ET.228.01.1.1]TGS03039.1 lytic transglycosylase domain-containing protein [bacterium M00.F.Ca.ET.191.01.1.1]TGU06421.1 lytic transglycosylase domain-containing protein [bacterium M00.F.Ca.ET.155.01.1.1]MBW0448785.1 transglycosylase SLT domain-containing protein [Paraburkholderia phenoliruptrix]MBW9097762.1 transglycosylase SLT domain
MSRLLCLILLSLGLAQSAVAEESGDRVSAYLTQKFGIAKEKAEKISDAVQSAASKYSLPPALLLAIISIESRFKEKAKGANGATGLMQVVPSAHRGLLRNVKDLTEPTANIEVGSAILYGYMRSANGDMNAALKSYGGSQAYAQKVSLRAGDFANVAPHPGLAKQSDARADTCDIRVAARCADTFGNRTGALAAPSARETGSNEAASGAQMSAALPAPSN